MELKQLQYFRVVAEMKNISKAAEMLYITQSALSRVLLRLEDELEVPLFIRSHAGVSLTESGQAFYRQVVLALDALDTGVTECRHLNARNQQQLSIASSFLQINEDLFIALRKQYPDIRLQITVADPDTALQQLAAGSADFAFLPSRSFPHDMIWLPLLDEEMLIVVPEGHPLSGQRKLRIQTLEAHSFVCSEVEFGRHQIEEIGKLHGLHLDVPFQSNDLVQRQGFQRAYQSLQFIPISTVMAMDEKKYQEESPLRNRGILRVDPPVFRRNMGIAYVNGRTISTVGKTFFDAALDYFKTFRASAEHYLDAHFPL